MPKSLKQDILKEIHAARALLEDLAQLGLSSVYPLVAESQQNIDGQADSVSAPDFASWDGLGSYVSSCTRCALSLERQNVVFGVGSNDAEIVFVGEAPGRDEDAQGEPFVGEAGKLLDRILHAMGLNRSSVYICNVIKCRPPKNRDPKPEEIETCEPYLIRQIELIQPRIVVALGKFAAQTLLQTDTPISRLRGKWHTYQGIPLMPTFHPAYLLRNSSSKRDVWEDMKMVLQRVRQEG